MGFESGSISFRMFYLAGRMPGDAIRRFAKHAAPPLDALGREAITGWVTGRHLLDRNITEETAHVAGHLRLTLMKAERKIPESLLRAECFMEELAELQARGVQFLKREVRSEIRRTVMERILPNMPPTLQGIPFVHDSRADLVYAGATAEKQTEAFIIQFGHTTGVTLVPATPAAAALKRMRVNVRDIDPTSFSPECEDALASDSLGQDFLTWLWFHSEARGGMVRLDNAEFAAAIEGPLLFVNEGDGAHEALLRRGTPLVSTEAKTALLSGKKLRCARLTVARGDEMWTCSLDAETFTFRGLKMPKGDAVDPVGRFQERMLSLETFREAFLGFFDEFIKERSEPALWKATRKDIHAWVAGRTAKR